MGLQLRSAGGGGFITTHGCGCVAVKWTEGPRDTKDGEFIGLSGKKRKLLPTGFLGSATDSQIDIPCHSLGCQEGGGGLAGGRTHTWDALEPSESPGMGWGDGMMTG